MKHKMLIYTIIIGLLLIGTITCELLSLEDVVKDQFPCGDPPTSSSTQQELEDYQDCLDNL